MGYLHRGEGVGAHWLHAATAARNMVTSVLDQADGAPVSISEPLRKYDTGCECFTAALAILLTYVVNRSDLNRNDWLVFADGVIADGVEIRGHLDRHD